jgi:hypothetical protein
MEPVSSQFSSWQGLARVIIVLESCYRPPAPSPRLTNNDHLCVHNAKRPAQNHGTTPSASELWLSNLITTMSLTVQQTQNVPFE